MNLGWKNNMQWSIFTVMKVRISYKFTIEILAVEYIVGANDLSWDEPNQRLCM